jgi:hypothetical protein
VSAPVVHPSFLALDRHALGEASPEVAAHAATCGECAAYLAAAGPSTAPVPAWARDAGARRPWFAWSGLRAFTLAVATVVLVVGLVRHRGDEESYVGTKGTPGAWLFVKRGADVHAWDGREPVAPGDRLRLKVQGAGFAHVSVFEAVATPPGWERLYDGALGAQAVSLPSAWEVDERPGAETLVVVLAKDAVAPADVAGLAARGGDEQHWLRRFVLEKRAPP